MEMGLVIYIKAETIFLPLFMEMGMLRHLYPDFLTKPLFT